jgi:hypothetical protein
MFCTCCSEQPKGWCSEYLNLPGRGLRVPKFYTALVSESKAQNKSHIPEELADGRAQLDLGLLLARVRRSPESQDVMVPSQSEPSRTLHSDWSLGVKKHYRLTLDPEK